MEIVSSGGNLIPGVSPETPALPLAEAGPPQVNKSPDPPKIAAILPAKDFDLGPSGPPRCSSSKGGNFNKSHATGSSFAGRDKDFSFPRSQKQLCDRCSPLQKNDVIPFRSKKNPLLFGPANAAATEEPALPSLSGHDYSLDFRNIRATRACNTVKVTIALRSVAPPPPRALAQEDTVKAERVLVEQPLSDRLLLNYGNSENQSSMVSAAQQDQPQLLIRAEGCRGS
ncbi:unnamed protein product, partial [Pleuronectes platessa]